MKTTKYNKRIRRHARVRALVSGTSAVPRVSVFRSNRSLFVQFIDDVNRTTLLSTTREAITGTKSEIATKVGETLAHKAQEKGIKKIVFDRGGYRYHGRVKALADGLRKGGLEF